jgi:hypothetical protein
VRNSFVNNILPTFLSWQNVAFQVFRTSLQQTFPCEPFQPTKTQPSETAFIKRRKDLVKYNAYILDHGCRTKIVDSTGQENTFLLYIQPGAITKTRPQTEDSEVPDWAGPADT